MATLCAGPSKQSQLVAPQTFVSWTLLKAQGTPAFIIGYEQPLPPRKAPGTFDVMRSIVENRGPAGLFTGALARVGKVAPACAIMMLSYEAGKRFFGERNAAAAAARTQ